MSHDTASPDTDEILWEQLAPHLDQAVAALSEADRSAILLRFYEKMPLRGIGEKMGVSEEAAKKRVSRAVEKLREFLDRRGVKLSGVALAAVLAEKTVQTASAALAGAVVKISMAAASASASTMLPQLARETLSRLALGKAQAGGGTRGGFAGFGFRGRDGRWLAHAPGTVAVSCRDWLVLARTLALYGADPGGESPVRASRQEQRPGSSKDRRAHRVGRG